MHFKAGRGCIISQMKALGIGKMTFDSDNCPNKEEGCPHLRDSLLCMNFIE